MKLIKDMTEPELREFFSSLAREIENLPPGPSNKGKCLLFFLIVSDQIDPGISQYVANVRREDAIPMLRETADE